MGFSNDERERLLAVKGVGSTVISRFEQLGYGSLPQLAKADPNDILGQVAAMLGTSCWRNSPQAKAAITAAVELARTQSAAKTSSKKPAITR